MDIEAPEDFAPQLGDNIRLVCRVTPYNRFVDPKWFDTRSQEIPEGTAGEFIIFFTFYSILDEVKEELLGRISLIL